MMPGAGKVKPWLVTSFEDGSTLSAHKTERMAKRAMLVLNKEAGRVIATWRYQAGLYPKAR